MKQSFVEQIKGNDPMIEKPKNVIQGTVSGYPVNAMFGVNGGAFWRIVVDAKQGQNPPGLSLIHI